MSTSTGPRQSIPILIVLSIAFLLRFYNLGYSDYQGDETQTFFLNSNQSIMQFLLNQKRGPIQFLVTAGIKGISNNYDNYLVTRFPFALAGSAVGIFFYLFVKKLTNYKTALFSLLFFTTNGIFVAFSRIVQYQTLVMLFITLTLYFSLLFVETGKSKFLRVSFLTWCLGLLTHSDSIFIAPFLLGVLISWSKKYKRPLKDAFKSLLLPVFLMTITLVGFYVPLILNSSSDTKNYWVGRFTGTITRGVISSTYLYRVYQPIYGLYIFEVLGALGFLVWAVEIFGNVSVFRKKVNKIHPCLTKNDNIDRILFTGVLFWFLSALLFMEVLTKFPGTHIWTYIYPLIVFIGYGLYRLGNLFKGIFKSIFGFMILVIFTFLSMQSYYIFVDHNHEYPWEKQKILIWNLDTPDTQYQLSLFGFPYNRHWKEIRDYILSDAKSPYYSTNEKLSIPRYYLPLEKDSDKAGYFIHIVKPQSFANVTLNRRGAEWMKRYPPVMVYKNGDRDIARIYLVPEGFVITK